MTVSVLLHCYTTAFTSVSPVNIINALHLFLIAAVTLVWRLYCSTARGECSCISGPSVICQADWPCLWEGELHTQLRQLFPHVLWEGNHFSDIYQMHGLFLFFFFQCSIAHSLSPCINWCTIMAFLVSSVAMRNLLLCLIGYIFFIWNTKGRLFAS